VGTTTVTWTATDGGGNAMSCPQVIVVNDVEPPLIKDLTADPNVLWPPNHTMRMVNIDFTVTDNCTATPAIVCGLGVTSNEPSDGTGDGHTSPDWQVLDVHRVLLRAERAAPNTNRIYTATVTCEDEHDNSSSAFTVVTVPRDQRH